MPQPKHDPFFTSSMEHSSIARSFFQYHLPLYLKEYISWKDLARMDRTATSSSLKKLHQDIIYKAGGSSEKTIILGVEHQSKADLLMPVRFLHYNANILEAYLKEGNSKFPFMVNILIYHGIKSPYPFPYPIGRSNYSKQSIWDQEDLFLKFVLIDLTQLSDQVLLTHGVCAPVEILLKHSRDGKFELPTPAYIEVFHHCIQEVGDNYITGMLSYADSLQDYEVGERMHKFVEEVFQDKNDIIMTYGQKLRQEAMQQGVQQGVQQGKIAIAKNMLQEGSAIGFIQKITGLTQEVIKTLKEE